MADVKDSMPRFSVSQVSLDPADFAGHDLRKAGYVKRTKSLFVMGVKSLEVQILQFALRIGGTDQAVGEGVMDAPP